KLHSKLNWRKAGSMNSASAFMTTLSRTLAIWSGRGFVDPGLLMACARSLLNAYVPALSCALISPRFSSNPILNAFIVTLSKPLDNILRLEISFQALRRKSLSEIARRADVHFIQKYCRLRRNFGCRRHFSTALLEQYDETPYAGRIRLRFVLKRRLHQGS